MTFPRVKIGGWGVGDPLTSAQQNQLDLDHIAALDGANGGLYALAALLTLDGVGGVQLNKALWNKNIVTTGYTLDSTQFDFVILADTSGPGFNVTLTAAVAKRVVIVKHYLGTNTLGVVPNGTDTIDGLNAPLALNQKGSGVVLVGVSSSAWITIAKV